MNDENIGYKERIAQTHEFISTCIDNWGTHSDTATKFIEGMMYATALIENKPPQTIRMMKKCTKLNKKLSGIK